MAGLLWASQELTPVVCPQSLMLLRLLDFCMWSCEQ